MFMTSRHETPTPWGDQPRQKEFNIKIDGHKTALNIGNCAIGLFRHRPEMDYVAMKDEEDTWTLVFDRHPMVYWMGGIAIGQDARHQQHLVERNQGAFADRYGWNADVVIEDYPSQWEVETYLAYQASGSEDLHADLNKALEEDFKD